MDQNDNIIRLIDLKKSFNGQAVLRGVSLDLCRGCTTVVLGPSGCGKTVMLKHVIGLLQPDSGQVIFDGRDIAMLPDEQMRKVRTRFGFLFQGGALFDSMTAADNVSFPLIEHAVHLTRSEIRDRAMVCLKMVGLSKFSGQMPSDLSGGQRKRVALARAIALEPQVILYDEPTTGLDPIRSDVINELILKLKHELNVSSLVVTHDMTSAFKVGDRLIMLHEGRVLADAPPDRFGQINEPTVQRFIHGQANEDDQASLKAGD